MVDKDVFAQANKLAEVGIERRENRYRLVDLGTHDFTQPYAELVRPVGTCLHMDAYTTVLSHDTAQSL